MPNPVRKFLFVGSFSQFIGLYLLLSKYLPRENLLGKLYLTPRASFVADHHSSRSNERYRSVPRRFYKLSFGIISYFHPNSMKIRLESRIQAISRTAWPSSTLLLVSCPDPTPKRGWGLGTRLHFSILCTGVGVAPVM